ncbi:MAG TPA: hypothetical protein VL053_03660 [Arachidicoccus sp.]|nr:hypothetical protein [Arachidicoccus sp.]
MDTHLPDFVLARLYRDSLVIPDKSTMPSLKLVPKGNKINLPETTISPDKAHKVEKWWHGENRQRIAIVIADADNKIIGEKEAEFLTNILAACKLTLEDVAIINYAKSPLGYTEMLSNPGCDKFILFGVTPLQVQLQFSFPYYLSQAYDNCNFMLAQPLQNMMQTSGAAKEEKKKLWMGLKGFFQL